MINSYIKSLVNYGLNHNLLEPSDVICVTNKILGVTQLYDFDPNVLPIECELHETLFALTQNMVDRGIIEDNIISRDLFDTKLMGTLTPFPREIIQSFEHIYQNSPQKATDWFYQLNENLNYIRKDRILKDRKWKFDSIYGKLDITINLSKPEKDPKAIAEALKSIPSNYPKCQLCVQNEGYYGNLNHPARQNLRMIPINIHSERWFFQYSPYVYYNEHCIVLNSNHVPMEINQAVFDKLCDFLDQFPHYFIGSNADLPIVGGSILSHEHFQGGRYEFAMEKAPLKTNLYFKDFEDIEAGIVFWPLSTIRIKSANRSQLIKLANKILDKWRSYNDLESFIFSNTNGENHNTITPIARKKDGIYSLDLVLRNNITTKEHPLGVYHPHSNLHHIKKENIGLIEVMGLAVLPARLEKELLEIEKSILENRSLKNNIYLNHHYLWVESLKEKYQFTPTNISKILQDEIGNIFQQVLEDCGVFKQTEKGMNHFLKFIEIVNK